MTIPATSNLAKIKEAAATTLAFSAKWQSWTGSANPAAAFARVHYRELTAAQLAELPRTMVSFSGPVEGMSRGIPHGTLEILFFAEETDADLNDQETALLNNVGTVLEEMRALSESGAADYLYIRDQFPTGVVTFPAVEDKEAHKAVTTMGEILFGLEAEGG